MDKDIAIEVKNLTKIYKLYDKPIDRLKDSLGLAGKGKFKEHRALNNVSLSVKKGETVGIIGTNGSGKSTILKIITGVLSPTEGEVNVDGHISALLELGAGFNMEYNGIDNIYLNGMMIGFSEEEIEKRMDAILEFADIGDYVYQPVKTYSSGMFVRLAFAVAINIDPEILIVDEALSVGDVFFQAKCYHKFEEFKKKGKTILFVSHDLSSISKYCDRAVLLNQGVLLGEGTPKKMIDIYKQVLVGQYPLPSSDVENLLDDESIREAAASADKRAEAKIKKETDKSKEASEKTNAQEELSDVEALEYGDGAAVITEYYITDNKDVRTNSIIKGTDFTVHMRVKFNRNVSAPIFAMTFKNVMGIEITGTNSMVEKAFLEPVKAGDVKDITFTQNMSLQGGDYLLSFGVTGFEQNDFTVYHRLYDALSVSVVSDKNTVGYYDMNSVCKVSDAKK
ncbi:teichoic acid transport system ATP-binding protein [Butyrivibrio proteoclasticus]|uniref:Teichoic acid transport system ATP-binding protein n=1 Tax=Butyrivibrio proteoclasticus TaxID=43305 RepID=A0A1I5VP98_9FIRM|nr:ABC transporter ATP-binding protein [Butyrivibrio proteoclasticus]SFQ09315.1 teichoic acid transport system ATP-binding protein [Butyrivibrio proteoclasticus]